MSWKTASFLAAAFTIGLVTVYFWSRSPAHAQRPEAAPTWEFKVVRIASDQLKESDRIETMTKQMNEAAAGGWEYVGLVAVPVREPFKTGSHSGDGYVAFRRPKK
jgi:hypothetical protein